MPENFWNERYASKEYVYGTSPNLFFKEQIDKLDPGQLLTLAEGEGRNGVYAAEKGWKVTAVDYSKEGRKKALQLAEERNVRLIYHLQHVENYEYPAHAFDALSLIYAHFPAEMRQLIHRKAMHSLKKGGHLFLEAYHKQQINRDTGGPKNVEMLYSLDDLTHDFEKWNIIYSKKMTTHIDEGMFHNGEADIVRLIVEK